MYIRTRYLHLEKLPAIASSHLRLCCCLAMAVAVGCGGQKKERVSVQPKNFKVQVPFLLTGRGIIINTYWGAVRKQHVLCIDNHSPSWIKQPLVKFDASFVRSKDKQFHTETADGTTVDGEIGICDTLRFEGVSFTRVPFYIMPANAKDNAKDDGVFGSELLSKGVLKIDFKKSELTFASAPDSIDNIREAEVFPSAFTNDRIALDVVFGNKVKKVMAVDLGFNGDLLLPASEFQKVSKGKKVFGQIKQFSTPASFNIISSSSVLDTVNINRTWFLAIISSNEAVTERLVGLHFFRRFDYVIFDFINRRIYLPKKIW